MVGIATIVVATIIRRIILTEVRTQDEVEEVEVEVVVVVGAAVETTMKAATAEVVVGGDVVELVDTTDLKSVA